MSRVITQDTRTEGLCTAAERNPAPISFHEKQQR